MGVSLGRKLRKITRWSQFVSLCLAQLAVRTSLRNVVSNLKAQAGKLYVLGAADVNRSVLARINEQGPHSLYESPCGKLLNRCQAVGPKQRFRFKKTLFTRGLDHRPVHEVNLARRLDLPGGSLVVFDRGYTDYSGYNQLNSRGIYFVARQKKNASYTGIERRSVS